MAPYSGDERRAARRYPLDTAIEYSIVGSPGGNRVTAGWGLDISETGISFQPAERLVNGMEVQLLVPWPWSPGTANLRLSVVGRVLRSDENRCVIGIRCYNYHITTGNLKHA